ncbi:MAG: Lhr family ATP-dependent helicase, partial [Armatimonadota bacterium]
MRTSDPQFICALLEEGRLVRVTLPGARRPHRLVADECLEDYLPRPVPCKNGKRNGSEPCAERSGETLPAVSAILERHIANRAVVVPGEIAADYGFPIETVEAFVRERLASGDLVEISPAPGSSTARWISPANFDVIYRHTLAAQKAKADRASSQQYSNFLVRWQHIHPDCLQRGAEGVRAVLGQLQGLWLPYAVWEPDVLARRLADFRSDYLDSPALSAEFVWIGCSSDPEKPGNLAFIARENFNALYPLLRAVPPEAASSTGIEAVSRCLEERGASFLIDIVAETGLDSRIVQRALWELVWRGEVTHDHLKVLRSGPPPAVLNTGQVTRRRAD